MQTVWWRRTSLQSFPSMSDKYATISTGLSLSIYRLKTWKTNFFRENLETCFYRRNVSDGFYSFKIFVIILVWHQCILYNSWNYSEPTHPWHNFYFLSLRFTFKQHERLMLSQLAPTLNAGLRSEHQSIALTQSWQTAGKSVHLD